VAPVTLNIHHEPGLLLCEKQFAFPSKSNSFSSCWRTSSSTRNNSRSLQVHIPHHASAPARETIRVPSKSKTFSSIMLAHQFLLGIQFPCPSRSNTIFMLLAHQVQHKIHFAYPSNTSSHTSRWRTYFCRRNKFRSSPTHLHHASAPATAHPI